MKLFFGGKFKNKKFLKLREIAKEVNYASDYISWLLRKRKIKGKRIEAKPAWFVETKSFIDYCKKRNKLLFPESNLLKKDFLTLKEASRISGYARDYIGYLVRRGEIKGEKRYVGSMWLVSKEEILKYKRRLEKFWELPPVFKYATFFVLISLILVGVYFYRPPKFLVKAQGDLKIVPTSVSGDWINLSNVLSQETKENSQFEDFTKENSTFLFEFDSFEIQKINCEQNSKKEEGGIFETIKRFFSFNFARAESEEQKENPESNQGETILNESFETENFGSTTPEIIEGATPTEELKTPNEKTATPTEKEVENLEKTRVLEISDFEIPPEIIEQKVSNVQLRVALAARPLVCNTKAKLLIEYFYRGAWQKLTEIELKDEISNRLNGGYLLFGLPIFENQEDLRNFELKFTYIGKEKEAQVFVDAVWLEMGFYQEKKDEGFELVIPKKDWGANENPTFVILDKREENILKRTVNKINKLFRGEPEFEVSTILFDPEGRQHHLEKGKDFKTETYSPTTVTIFKPENFRPGKYKVTIDFEKDGKSYHFEPEFTWGVLAINANKSIYLPGEKAFFQMAVLDTLGHTVCDANLTLEITTPSGKKTIFTTEEIQIATTTEETATSTIEEATTSKEITTTSEEATTENENLNQEIENQPSSFLEKIKKFFGISEVSAEELFYGKIEKSGECGPNNVTDKPDYFAFYDVSETGQYQIKLTAKTKEGTFEIYDSFDARDYVPFEIERIGPTRIYPPADYQMKIKIKANEDFDGEIKEKIPQSFAIVNCSGCQVKEKEIVWKVNFEKGKDYEFNFTFNAPNISPYLYLLGPIELYQNNSSIFSETRQWQIAADAIETRYMRSDQQTVNYLLAYVLGTTQSTIATSSQVTQTGSGGATVYWGIRVWKRDSAGNETEITSGTPVAQVSRNANGEGIQSATWLSPTTTLSVSDAIVIRVYIKVGTLDWAQGNNPPIFITERLLAGQLNGTTWTVYYYTKYETVNTGPPSERYTRGTFYWGNSTYNSQITNFSYSQPTLYQNTWRFFWNKNSLTPGSPMANENATATNAVLGEPLRLRMNLRVEDFPVSTSSLTFKLQYATSTGNCASISSWVDVGDIGSTTIWRGYNNTSSEAIDGATTSLPLLLSDSNVPESYEESNPSARNPYAIGISQRGEWDWVIQNYGGEDNTAYCFRVVNLEGLPINYLNYPVVISRTPKARVSSQGNQVTNLFIPSTNQYVGGKFVISASSSVTVTKIIVSATGTVDFQNDLSNVKLFYDLDTTYPYDCESESYSGNESQFGTTTNFSSTSQAVFEGSVSISPTSTLCAYLVLDVNSSANEGENLDIEISNPVTDVVLDSGLASPSMPVEIPGTTTLIGSTLIQDTFRWFENQDNIQPGNPKAGENSPIFEVKVDDVLRLRVNILVQQGTLQSSSTQFKLQYSQGTNCSQITDWVDVDSISGSGDGAFFRGYDNPSVSDGATITTTTLSNSNVGLSYEEENPTVANPNQVLQGQRGELDFVILNYGAPPNTTFCFRIVKANGTPLNGYTNYPKLTTGTRGGWIQTKKNEFDQGVLENVTTTETGEVVLSKACPDGDLILNGATTTISGEKYYCNVRLTNGAVLYTSSTEVLKIHAISIYIDSTSRIDGDGRGYPGAPRADGCGVQQNGSGPGAGTGGYATVNDNGPGGGGGGYGGAGGNGGGAAVQGARDFYEGIGGSTYGSSTDESLYLGSGGGAGGDSCRSGTTGYGGAGGAGGGAVLLDAETIEIAGTVTMKGENGEAGILGDTDGTGGGGGGSGGTILIKGKNVIITGTLDVRGGNGGAMSGTRGGAGGGGGGGRIKIFAESLDSENATLLYSGGINGGPSGGSPAAQDGQSGTLFTQQITYISSMYPDTGKIASQVFDTTYDKAAFIKLSWMEEITSTCDITFEVRASNSPFSKDSPTPSWIDLGTQNSPVTSSLPVGRYKQWRATLHSCENHTQTPILKEVLVVYDSAPPPIIISGKIYMDEGENVLHTTPTVSIAVNENFVTSTVASSTDGSFSFTIESPSAGDTIFVFLDDPNYKGVTVTHYPGTGNITDLDIYQNRLVLRHHDAIPIKNSDLAKFDKSKDSNITYQVSSGNLTLDSDQRLFIFPNSTFKPEGNVTTLPGALSSQVGGDIKISSGATFNVENYTISCGGDWINYGSFLKSSGQTVVFTATSSGFTINNGSSHFENLTFNGGGSWQFLSSTILDGNLSILAGTLTGDQDISVFGGNVTGNGEINLTGGTFLVDGTGNFGGDSNWTFYHLTFGDGTGSGQISATGTGEVRVNGNFTIASGQTLSGSKNFKIFGNVEGDGQINLSGGEFLVDGNVNFGGATNWTFYNLTFGDGQSPQATINFVSTNSINVTNNLVVNAYQKVQGTKNINVYGSLTGDGQIEMTGQTVMVDGESFGSNSNWIFYNLTFGDGSGTQTTQKIGTGNVEIKGVLTISANQTLKASSTEWILSGSGTPFLINGTFNPENSTFKYTSTSTTNITPATYYNLYLIPQASTTYTILSGNLTTNNDFIIGDGINPLTVNANTQDPTINVRGNFEIKENSTFIASDQNPLYLGGNYTNSGNFTHSNSTVIFNATSTGKTINPGNSPFYNVKFDSSSGGWTITSNTTSTNNFEIISAQEFIATGTITIEVQGEFKNYVGGNATDWASSTLYLNSGKKFTINNSTSTGDNYYNLKLGPNTHVRIWNSSSQNYDIDPSASLYSMDHQGEDGLLYIFGYFEIPTSTTEYWSYNKDFDGTDISSSPRQVNVRIYPGSTIKLSGGTLEIVGTSSATTTIDRQNTSGFYSFIIQSGTANFSYYQIRGTDSSGLQILGGSIQSLNYGDFLMEHSFDASLITISASVISSQPQFEILGCIFATSTDCTNCYNAKLINGTSTTFWRFRNHSGGFDGERYDFDSGDPGEIRWDDSAYAQITVSGRVLDSQWQNPSQVCDGQTPVVRLKLDGQGDFATSCSPVDGSYSISGVWIEGDVVLTVYLDGTSSKAVTVTRSILASTTDFDLYENWVIVRNEGEDPISISHLQVFDSDQDPDIPFDAETGSLTIFSGNSLYVWPGKKFKPSGNVTIEGGDLKIGSLAQFISEDNQTHSVGGSFLVSVGGILNSASSTFVFTASSTGKQIRTSEQAFYNLVFNGQGGEWEILDALTVNNNLTMLSGTLTGSYNVTVKGGSATGTNGVINLTGGTFTLDGNGNFGANSTWTFNNLTFGDGQGTQTTQKIGSGNVEIKGVLTITSGHTLKASNQEWILSGSGTPFVKQGTLDPENSTFKYTSTSTTNITPATYYNLYLIPQASTTYTILSGNLTTNNDFIIGDGINPLTVNANTQDPTINVRGNFEIKENSTFIASDQNPLYLGGNYTNSGNFTHSNSTVIFNATSTGKTINPGNSPFYNVKFDSSSGGWTITSNTTSTNNFEIISAQEFIATGTITIEVQGEFKNYVGGNWASSTLYLNSGKSFVVNQKNSQGTQYYILKISNNTHVKIWNSSAQIYDIDSSSSLYSMDHQNTNGLLYIFGNFEISTGTEYWSYSKDFDGTLISGRQCQVKIASSSSITLSGGRLEIVGIQDYPTLISNQGEGTFSFNISGGTLRASYYRVRNTNSYGLNFSGSPTIESLDYGDFLMEFPSNANLITLTASVINQNPALTINGASFVTSTSCTNCYNVYLSGTPSSYWRFTGHTGGFDGEDFDYDPGGDPGYIQWDNSNYGISVSGYVLNQEGGASQVCDGATPVVRLKVSGTGDYATSCRATDGYYRIDNVSFTGDIVLTVYLDGASQKAVTVSRSPGADISNFNLIENHLILRHEGTNPISISHLQVFDSDQDPDIPFDAETGSLTVFGTTTLYILSGKEFKPGGDVTLEAGDVKINNNSKWTCQGTETHTIGGNFRILSGGILDSASSTFIFTATSSKEIQSSGQSFYNIVFNGENGQWTIQDALSLNGNLTMLSGTLTGSYNVTVKGGSATGTNGVINLTGGTFTLDGNGNFGANSTWTFNNLTFGDGQGTQTTQKIGSGNVEIKGVLTITSGHTLKASNQEWILSGSGTPFVKQGTLDPENSTFKYTSTSTTNITPATYYNLYLIPQASTTYTILSGNLTTNNDFIIGDGINPLTVNANTQDPTINVRGNFEIKENSTFIASDQNPLYLGGNYTNSGNFTHSNSTVIFNATSTGKTINPGNSPFYNVKFDSSSGGWTITSNTTSTNNFEIISAQEFIATGTITIEVQGEFKNYVGGNATDWASSTLYLNSGKKFTINNSTSTGDNYYNLKLGPNTHVRIWNSSSQNYDIDPSASLYSMDHQGEDGLLYIFGYFEIPTSTTEYWSYNKDFDGTDISSSPRQVNVRIYPGSTIKLSGGTLEIVGTSSATTTIDRQGDFGTYAFEIEGGTLKATYYQIRRTNSYGLKISGTPQIQSLDYGDFLLQINGGSLITLDKSVIEANPEITITGCIFATSTGIDSGYNVRLNGTTTHYWKFTQHSGGFDGEQYDFDSGDPGEIRWDDSQDVINVSGRVLRGDFETVSEVCDGQTPVVMLKAQGGGNYTAPCDPNTGEYTILYVPYQNVTVYTVYLNTNGGQKATTITIDPYIDITDLNLYENWVVVRHERDNPITISHLAVFDSDNDSDVLFNATSGSLVVNKEAGLLIWPQKEFKPQGNIALESGGSGDFWDGTLKISPFGKLTLEGQETISIGGSLSVEDNAILSSASSTFVFTATSTGKQIKLSGQNLWNIKFDGQGGQWSFATETVNVLNDFEILQGTVNLSSATTSVGGNFINSGTFNHNSGTVVLTATSQKTLNPGNSAFNNLILNGQGGIWQLASNLQSQNLTIEKGTLSASTSDITLTGNFVISSQGAYQKGTGNFTFAGTGTSTISDQTLTKQDLGNLIVDGTSKTLLLNSEIKLTNLTIGSDDTLDVSSNNYQISCLGSFANNGTFNSRSGTVKFIGSGQNQIKIGNSTFYNIVFENASGSWTLVDSTFIVNNDFQINSGTVTSTSGTLRVGGSFNNSGNYLHNQGTLEMVSSQTGKTIHPGNSTLYNLTFNNSAGSWNFAPGNFTIDNNFTISAGSVTLPSGTLTIKGNFANSGTFNHNSGTVKFSATATGKTINTGGIGTGKNFYNVEFDSPSGGWTILSNLRAENNFSIKNAGSFTLQSGRTLEVNGVFTNLVGGASTTWTDTTLYLNKTGGGTFTINTKTQGGDVYGTLQIGPQTHVRMWNSSAQSYSVTSSASLYSMDHQGVDGSLYIWGNYQIGSGKSDYWSFGKDFDGEVLATGRQVNVRISPGSSITLAGGTLEIVGTSSATTTIDRQGSTGNYSITLNSGTFKANYYQIRNIDANGLYIAGDVTVQSLDYGDYLLQITDGTMLKVNYQAINKNASLVIKGCIFNKAAGVTAGYNVYREGTANSAWIFTEHSGNYAGESYDYDPDADCGQIRWDDSVCYLHEQVSYRWRADNGIEILGNWTKKKAIPIINSSSNNLTDYQVKIKVGYTATSSANVDCGGNCQIDFDDIRFVSFDEKSVLNYWRESYSTSGIAVFWVKIPSLPANSTTTIYMYYGNPDAEYEGSGEKTFIFFDDFSGDLSTKWTSLSNATTIATTSAHYGGKVLSVGGSGSTNGSAFVRSSYFYGRDVAARILVYDLGNGVSGSEDADLGFLARYVDANNYLFGEHDTDIGFHMNQVVSGNQTQLAVNSGDYIQFNQWEWQEWIFWGTSAEDHKAKHWNYATSEPSTYSLTASAVSYFSSGVIGLRTFDGQALIDVIFLRKYNSIEPTIGTPGSEETAQTAQWLGPENTKVEVEKGENVRVRFLVRNTGDNLTSLQYRIQFAPKGDALSCEAVATSSFVDVPTTTSDIVFMATSSWFVGYPEDYQDQTTHQMIETTNSTFVPGRMVEAETNQTGQINLNSYQFTEIEYVIRFSQNATGSIYCFRVKLPDKDLDNYRKVATIEISQPPQVSNVSLNNGENIYLIEGSTTSVYASATVYDLNGYQDITSISAKIFRSGVGEDCSENSNNCYNAISCATTSCSDISCNVLCEFWLWFNADPTYTNTPWESENWVAKIVATDSKNYTGSATNSAESVEVMPLLAISAPPSLSYGSLSPGQKTDPLSTSTIIYNTGNCSLDLSLYGQDMRAGNFSISVSKQRFATSSINYDQAIPLSYTSTTLDLNIPKNTSTSSLSTAQIWWGIEIPIPQPALLYQGINYLEAQINQLPW